MTRRIFLTLVPGSLSAFEAAKQRSAKALPPNRGEFVRFLDRTTETPVVRLTSPQSQNWMPDAENRFVSSREGFFVFASDRAGAPAPYHANLKTGVITRLGGTPNLAPRSLALDAKDRELWLVDGGVLKTIDLRGRHEKTLVDQVDAFHLARGKAVVIRRGDKLERWTPAGITPLAEGVASRGVLNASGTACLFFRFGAGGQSEIWQVALANPKPQLVAKGNVSAAVWRPDGQAILFLRASERNGSLAAEIREAPLDGSGERLVAPTSQFAAFGLNANGTVFVGASRSKAQPDIVLLLRSVRRELVICEHRARQAEQVSPAFSPNSQRVYFQSDCEGKLAIYSVNVERLVEQTEDAS